jgi:hypothetical protein
MACLSIAEAVSLDLFSLNVRVLSLEKSGGYLLAANPKNNSSSTPDSNLNFDLAIPGGVSWRRIS